MFLAIIFILALVLPVIKILIIITVNIYIVYVSHFLMIVLIFVNGIIISSILTLAKFVIGFWAVKFACK
jgi:hypothetical protein